MCGQNKPIYRAGISREGPTRIHENFPNAWKLLRNFTKVVTLLKIPTGQNPTVPVMSEIVRKWSLHIQPTPKKGHSGKRKTKHEVHSSDRPTGAKICFVHGPGHSTEDCKVLKEFSKNYAAQRTHKEKEAWSGGNKKRTKTVKFDSQTQEFNTMVYRDAPIPRKKNGRDQAKNPKSEKDAAVPSEEELTYGIYRLNLGKTVNDSEGFSKLENEFKHAYDLVIESKWLLAQRREGQMANQKNRNNSTKRECNILSNFFKLYKMRKI